MSVIAGRTAMLIALALLSVGWTWPSATAQTAQPARSAGTQSVALKPTPTVPPQQPTIDAGNFQVQGKPKLDPTIPTTGSSQSGIVTHAPGITPDLVVLPDYLRPGRHDLELTPMRSEPTRVRLPEGGVSCGATLDEPRSSSVGFQHFAQRGCTLNEYRQLAFAFDFSKLRGQRLLPLDAVLTFREATYLQRGPDGAPIYPGGFAATCTLQLAVPTVDWAATTGRIPYESARDQQGIGRFTNLLSTVSPMVNDQSAQAKGLILVGPDESSTQDNAACLSQVSGITLTFTYAISDH